MNYSMQKRGQVTLFIIIGILVVSLVVLGYYFRAELFKSEWEQGFAESLAIPDQAEEVHESISGCVEELAIEAVDILGMQGGYINIPEDPIPSTVYNPFSNSLEIFEGSGMKTVYWFYEASNAVQYSQIPLKEEMEAELGVYVDENLARCASNFSLYEEYNVSAGDVYTEVEILDDEVLFTVDYPVKVAVDESNLYPESHSWSRLVCNWSLVLAEIIITVDFPGGDSQHVICTQRVAVDETAGVTGMVP